MNLNYHQHTIAQTNLFTCHLWLFLSCIIYLLFCFCAMLSLLVFFLSVLFSIRINKVSFHVVLLKLCHLPGCMPVSVFKYLFLWTSIINSCQSKPPFSFIVFLIWSLCGCGTTVGAQQLLLLHSLFLVACNIGYWFSAVIALSLWVKELLNDWNVTVD